MISQNSSEDNKTYTGVDSPEQSTVNSPELNTVKNHELGNTPPPTSSHPTNHHESQLSQPLQSHVLAGEIRFLSIFFASLCLSILMVYFVYRSIWIPIIIGVVGSYLLDPWVRFLSAKTKLPRVSIVISAMAVFTLILLIFLILVIPYAKKQLMDIIPLVPETYHNLLASWLPRLTYFQEYLASLGLSSLAAFSLSDLQEFFSPEKITGAFKNTLSTVWSTVPGIISFFVSIVLAPCIMYISLQHSPKVRSYMHTLIPEEYVDAVQTIFTRLGNTLRSVITGQIYVALTLGILYCIGYSILDIKGAVAIGLAAGVGRLIPYMDMVIAMILSAAVILASDDPIWPFLIGSVMVITIVSLIDAIIVTPKLIGSSAGIHPVIVICTIIAFSSLLGFWGIIIAIPLTAMIKETLVIIIDYYKRWKLPQEHVP